MGPSLASSNSYPSFPNITHSTKYPYAEYASSAENRGFVIAACLLSAFGSLAIILSYICWKDIRTTSRKILLFLSLSDFLIAISNLLGLQTSIKKNLSDPFNDLCVTQSFITNSVSIMSFLWTLTLALYLYTAIILNKQELGKRLLPYCHVINWTLGPIINGIGLRYKMLGYSADALTGGWCWIYHNGTEPSLRRNEIIWHFLDAKALEIVVYSTIFVVYIRIKFKLHKELKIRSKAPMQPDVLKSAKSADRKLVFVPILLILGRIWSLIRFLDVLVSNGTLHKQTITSADKVLLTLQGVGDSIQGFLNCILFCFLNPKVNRHIKDAFMYYVCWKRHGSSSDHEKHLPQPDERSLNGENESTFTPHSQAAEANRSLLEPGLQIRKYGSSWQDD